MQIKTKIGCSGWHYVNWRGQFYPVRYSPRNFLSFYAQHFNTVEINNTFYQYPSLKIMESWYQNTPADFTLSIKINRHFTHTKRLTNVKEELDEFYSYGTILKQKLGYYLFQFPRTFNFNSENLSRILLALNPSYNNVVEFRNTSWWDPIVFDAFRSANIVFCTVSGFPVPDDLIIINKRAYIRFHGDPTYSLPYSNKELNIWKMKLIQAGLNECWAYFNNTNQGYATINAKELQELLNH